MTDVQEAPHVPTEEETADLDERLEAAIEVVQEGIDRVLDERERYREALEKVAAATDTWCAKKIAREALGRVS
jgi:hypothetical protein